jgi:hypothetical protein
LKLKSITRYGRYHHRLVVLSRDDQLSRTNISTPFVRLDAIVNITVQTRPPSVYYPPASTTKRLTKHIYHDDIDSLCNYKLLKGLD